MNKNIKKVIVIVLAIGAFSTIAPEINFNPLTTTKAYASSDGVTSLKVKNSSGNTLSIYSDNEYKSEDKVNDDELEIGKTYYTKTASDEVKISVSGVDSECVRVFDGTSSDSNKGERLGSSISLSDTTTTIIVRVYSSNPGTVKYGNDSYISQYRIKVKYTGSDDGDDDELDNVYLKSISLSSGNISFEKKTYAYDVSVEEDINKIEIAARPDCDNDEYDNYKVKINGTKVDQDDKFKKEVSLSKGKNVIEIKVEDGEDNERIYTLNVTRGGSTTDNSSSNNSSSNESSNLKTNQWMQVNGKWQYKDATGNSVKNTWIQNYFVQADGNMATGWLNYSGKWYYLGNDGSKKTGWQSINGVWYYLDSQGAMQTGWMRDISNGKYYYLNSDGSMAYSKTIGGYKLGADGAWVGR